jgi:SHAQKYF class myb-like DNA-binding protein
MTSLPPVADPTASLPPSSNSPSTMTIAALAPVAVAPAPLLAKLAPEQQHIATSTTVPTPVPVAPAPEATAAALAAVAAVGVPQPAIEASSSEMTAAAVTAAAAGAKPSPKAAGPSKKKKSQVTVTMATATAAQSGAQGAQGENTGRWTAEEHRLFLQGLELHGKGWKKIAGLIKSRTVVQIRTHAQKYFQKLSKAKQNGDEGEIMMEGRGGTASVPSVTTSAAQNNKRRKQTSGTKRKAIQSVVASSQREAKKLATEDGAFAGITSVAPALSPYVLPPVANPMDPSSSGQESNIPSVTTANGTISCSALEESLYVELSYLIFVVKSFVFEISLNFPPKFLLSTVFVTLHLSLWHHHKNSKSIRLHVRQVPILSQFLLISQLLLLPQLVNLHLQELVILVCTHLGLIPRTHRPGTPKDLMLMPCWMLPTLLIGWQIQVIWMKHTRRLRTQLPLVSLLLHL